MISIDFERGTDPYLYKDALHFTEEQFDAITQEEIEAMKDERFNNWYTQVTAPPVEVSTDAPVDLGPAQTININGEDYELLTAVPTSGAKLIEANGNWYQKVN